MSSTPAPADVQAAAERIRPHVRRTPLLRTEIDGRPLVLKLEHLQRSGSFKLRGAVNALLAGPRPDQVVTASGGNHGLGVATAAQVLGLPAVVYVPETVPEAKATGIEATGVKLVRHGATYAEAAAAARAVAEQPGTRYLHAYDDPDVIAGQGTVTAEIVAEAPDVDAIAIAVGGGGLASGTVLAANGRAVFAVEPQQCQALHAALEAGEPVDVTIDSVAASALGATRIGTLPFAILDSRSVTSVLVTDAEMLAARDRLWQEFRLVVEPAAAAPLAAWLAGRVPAELPCLVLCGANTAVSYA
ncbi:serine/threonine dehydratase [Amycolatopsis panacis]|uniref:Pyridoxal-phosphate dependent enzyme n=1 Tax=Amycolatopsis panacis TaxID=2340917 RepID=A0A419I5C0_9PSEU|nr:serine/threonine dehydratase [Amycolatopsis panacis]RJQ85884.1 pyridoxal-phosphate dependent enzyme [Amycolatopsis panacis]